MTQFVHVQESGSFEIKEHEVNSVLISRTGQHNTLEHITHIGNNDSLWKISPGIVSGHLKPASNSEKTATVTCASRHFSFEQARCNWFVSGLFEGTPSTHPSLTQNSLAGSFRPFVAGLNSTDDRDRLYGESKAETRNSTLSRSSRLRRCTSTWLGRPEDLHTSKPKQTAF